MFAVPLPTYPKRFGTSEKKKKNKKKNIHIYILNIKRDESDIALSSQFNVSIK